MEIIYKGNILWTVEDWYKYIYNESGRWKSGNSAETLDQFVCNDNDIDVIENTTNK